MYSAKGNYLLVPNALMEICFLRPWGLFGSVAERYKGKEVSTPVRLARGLSMDMPFLFGRVDTNEKMIDDITKPWVKI